MSASERFEALFPSDTRYHSVEELLTQVKKGNFVQVLGLPGVGRSHLVGLLTHNKPLRRLHLGQDEPTYHFIPVDFSELRGRESQNAVKLLFLSLIDSLHKREYLKEQAHIHEVFTQYTAIDDEMVLFHGLKQAVDYLGFERGLHLVFLFDHFEEFAAMATGTFFSQLGSLKAHAQYHLSVVFFLHRELSELVEPAVAESIYPLFAGHVVYLPVKDPVLLSYLVPFLLRTTNKTLAPETIHELEKETGGHGKMMKVALEEVSPDEIALKQFLRDNLAIRSVSYEIWGAFTPQEQGILRHLSLGQQVSEHPDTHEMLSYFEKIGVYREGEFTIPLFNAFVHYRATHALDEKIVYKPEEQEMYKGSVPLREMLTATEFALLAYLASHPDTVIDRDKLVTAAWSDSKSTAGVTDQAIDQLLFRLRHKIEDNPSEPRHIQTIKGQGVKFTP